MDDSLSVVGWGESEFTVVGDNKILTVSYGTFSCTLEGFDDPFSTMKNIAEYFRDLAAGDRFFGAEPPQPDPEMLQSIAEKTIKARVNAQLSDNNNLVLSQQGASGSEPQPTPAPLAAAAAPQVMPASAPGVETVAEKLQRIRAVVSRETAQDAFFSEDQHVEEFAAETTAPFGSFEDDHLDAPVDEAPVADLAIDETVEEEIVADAVPEPVEEDTVVSDDLAEPVSDEAPIVDVSEEFEDESDIDFSALMPTEAPVEENAADTSEEDDFADEDAALESALASITAEDTVAEEVVDTEITNSDDNPLDKALAREEAAEAAIDGVLGRVDEDEEATPEEVAPRRRIVVQKITREDLKAARDVTREAAEDDADNTATSDDMLSPDEEAELQRELAALQSGDVDEVVADDATHEASELELDIDLSNALNGMISDDASAYEAEEQEAARATRIARRDAIVDDQETDVERLMETTTSRLDNDESSGRRASIAHLKAAVAATKADASLTGAAVEQEARERDQYAEDLARVVRPERAQSRGDRVKTNRPAPLVLVSEQRIDKNEEEVNSAAATAVDDGPVRPRRISRAALDEADDTHSDEDGNIFSDQDQSSFAEYAASANALELPDLLEAAAAYYTYVESTEQFTRPMLMRKIASISARDGFSREAGLRSFGTLLREGKLVKGNDGKFVIAKNSRFTPEARYAGE